MKISFQKKQGDLSRNIAFYWQLTIDGDDEEVVVERFIPELFYDYFLVKRGEIRILAENGQPLRLLPRQSLKTLYINSFTLAFTLPMTVYGARLTLPFADSFWEDRLAANSILSCQWLADGQYSFTGFAAEFAATIARRTSPRHDAPLLVTGLEEADWLQDYSARHRRRLIRSTYGLSRKEMKAIQNLHAFLGQTCDFNLDNPRLIEHIDYDTFYDQPHLNRLFKKMTGYSPLAYFEASTILQDNLMSASYNATDDRPAKI